MRPEFSALLHGCRLSATTWSLSAPVRIRSRRDAMGSVV
jgi:hypothetical protein